MLNAYHFVNDAITFLIPTMMGVLYSLFELNYTQTSIILASNFGMIVLFQILNGYFADKKKEKQQYIIGIGFLSVSTFLLMYSTNFYSLWLFSTIHGIGLGFIHAILYVSGARMFPENRERKMAIQGFSGDLGKVIAIITSAAVIIINPNGWRIPLTIWSCVAAILFIIACLIIPKANFIVSDGSESQKSLTIEEEPLKLIANPSQKGDSSKFTRVKILLFILFIIYSGSQDICIKFFTLYMHVRRHGLSANYAELIFAVFMGVGMLGTLFSGYLKGKLGFRQFLTLVYLLNITALALFVFLDLDNFYSDLLFAGMIGYSILSIYITIQSELSFYISFKKLGLGYGLLLGIGWTGAFLTTLIVGPLADIYGERIIYEIALVMSIIAFSLVFLIPNRTKSK